MTITNGYCTLAELKERVLNARRYTAATISFVASTKKIVDTAKRLKRFQDGMLIDVTGCVVTANNTTVTVVTGNTAGEIVVAESIADAAAGASVSLTDISDPIDDAVMEACIESASRQIDGETCRRFFTTSVDEVRYFTAEEAYHQWTGDLISVTTLETDSDGDGVIDTTWTSLDFNLWPYNAALDGKPYARVDVGAVSSLAFPTIARGVKITGKFGWSAAPAQVKQACLIQAERLYRRKDAPFGVMGNDAFGTFKDVPAMDPDVSMLIKPFRRMR